MSIRLKLTIMFLVVALIPMLIVGILTFGNYKRSLETHRMSMLEELVIYKSDRIEAYFLGLKSNMEMAQNFYNLKNNLPILNQFANNPTAQEFLDARKTLDRQLQKMQTALKLSDIMLVDSKGRVVYVSNPKHSPKDFLSNLPDTQQTAFKEGRNKIYFSDVFFNKVNNDKLGMLITAPLNDSNNIFIGVIVFEIDMEPVYDIINYAYGLGETGETLIGKRIKNQIVYLNPLRHDTKAVLNSRIVIGEKIGLPIQEAVQGRSGVGRSVDYRDKKVIAAWRHIPLLNWGIVSKIDMREAFADATNLRNLTVVILIVTFILGSIIVFFIAQTFSKPIKKLSEGAEIIGSGDMDYSVGTKQKDEIGQLSRAFDKMTIDLKKHHKALEFERKRFNEVLDMLPAYVVLITTDYHVTFANRFFEERFGKSGGKRCYEYLFKRNEPCENCETFKVLKNNKPHHWEWLGPDNHNYDIYDFPFIDADGSPLILEMGIDITEQKQAKEIIKQTNEMLEQRVEERTLQLKDINIRLESEIKERRQIEEKLLNLYASMTEGVVLHDVVYDETGKVVDYIITDVNPAFSSITGLTKEIAIGKKASKLYGTGKPPYLDVYARVAASGNPESFETYFTPMEKHFSISVFSPGKGKFATVFQDITERKRTEIILQESEQRLNLAQEISHLGSWELDITNNKLSWSDEVYRIFGLKPQEFAATYQAFLEMIHPDDRVAVDYAYSSSLREGKDNYEIEHRIIRKSTGEVRFVHEKCEHFRDESGKIIRSVGMVQDVTERKKAEVELKHSNENLEQFAYVASHDLQEPLRMMASYSQLLEHRYKNKLDKDANEFIDFIVDGAKRMQKLINDLLAYARIDSKKSAVEVDCNSVLGKVINSMRISIEQNEAIITNDELPRLLGNESNFIQLFQNLIGNAIKFRSKESPRIHVGAKKRSNEWLFVIKDNGIGIEPQYKDRIFLIFQRLHARHEYSGTGIGLSICRKIVETLGGKIWVESEYGKGSTFYFTIPTPV